MSYAAAVQSCLFCGGLTSTAVIDCSVSILLLADIWVVLAVERYTCNFIEWLSIVRLRFFFLMIYMLVYAKSHFWKDAQAI